MKRLISSAYKVIEEANQEKDNNGSLNKKTVTVFLLLPFCLSMIYYWGHYDFARTNLLNMGANNFVQWMDKLVYKNPSSNLGELTYWICSLIVFYFVVPAITIKFFFKEKLSDYGLRLKEAFKGYYLYLLMLLVMIPLVLFFSGTESFQARYPFLKMHNGDSLSADFWKWELLYCSQFFALEFFFRGFVVFGLKPKLGFYSVFVMTIPYCMIHFGKPMPETIAAIIAGIVLGWLSLKNRSVWLGFLIHCSVGLSMDLASLWQKGFFG